MNENENGDTSFTIQPDKWECSSRIERNDNDSIVGYQEISLLGKFSYPKRTSESGESTFEFIINQDDINIEEVDVEFSIIGGDNVPVVGNGAPLQKGLGRLIYHGKTDESEPLFYGWCQVPVSEFSDLRSVILFQKQFNIQIDIETLGIRKEYEIFGIKRYLNSDESEIYITSIVINYNTGG